MNMLKKDTKNDDLLLKSLELKTKERLAIFFPDDRFIQYTTSERVEGAVELLGRIFDSEVRNMENYFNRLEACYLSTFYMGYTAFNDNPNEILQYLINDFEASLVYGTPVAFISDEPVNLEILREKIYKLTPLQAWVIQCSLRDYVSNWPIQGPDISELKIVS